MTDSSSSSSSLSQKQVATPAVSSNNKESAPINPIDQATGGVVAQYPCLYEGVSGVLYAGRHALYFVGTYFLFDKKMRLPWELIRQVVKIDQGVEVITMNDVAHSFCDMRQAEKVWPVLINLHNDALLDRKQPVMSTPERRTLTRRNSDPTAKSKAVVALSLEETASLDSESQLTSSTTSTSSSNHNQPTDAPKKVFYPVAGLTQEETDEKVGNYRLPPIPCTHDTVSGTLYVGQKGAYFYGRRYFYDVRKVFFPYGTIHRVQIVHTTPGICFTDKEGHMSAFVDMENPDRVWASLVSFHQTLSAHRDRMRGGGASRRGSMFRTNSDPNMSAATQTSPIFERKSVALTSERSVPLPTPTALLEDEEEEQAPAPLDLAQEWASCVAKKKEYSNLVVDNLALKCSLEDFVQTFVSHQAECSIGKFLESRGDLDIKTSEWTKDTKSPQLDVQKRVIHYTHPVNAPLAPPLAGARKEQTLTRFGSHGLCLETRTIVDDVPMADCFHVDDRIRVESKGTEEVAVSMEFEISFVKSTMFKSIISKTTKGQFSDLFKCWGDYMKNALEGAMPVKPVEPEPTAVQVAVEPPSPWQDLRGGALSYAHSALTILVFLLQLFILREMRAMRSDMASMQTQSCLEGIPNLKSDEL